MNTVQSNSITGVGSAASSAVASALTSRRTAPKATAKDATSTTSASNSTATTTSATTDASDITSSDFLTLLVSELKNQDPTQPTDPNAYISQLVGVNSLQQLIQINSGVTTLDGTATSSSTSGS